MKTKMIDVKTALPERKPNCNHSEQCLVWYEGVPNEKVQGFGISYYNYDPPFQSAHWVDFANYGRQPTHWMPLPEKPQP